MLSLRIGLGVPQASLNILREITPPVLLRAIRAVVPRSENDDPDQLFGGNDAMFKEHVLDAKCYAEYGAGKSTVWVANNTNAHIIAADTDTRWLKSVEAKIDRENIHYVWTDCGEIANWGRPRSYAKRQNFMTYAKSVWGKDIKPDLVLIDGRFRVLCFLNSVALASPGTKIIFDDYSDRPQYHIVEEVLKPMQQHDRQVLFEVPEKSDLDLPKINTLIEKFEYVMA